MKSMYGYVCMYVCMYGLVWYGVDGMVWFVWYGMVCIACMVYMYVSM